VKFIDIYFVFNYVFSTSSIPFEVQKLRTLQSLLNNNFWN